MRRVPAEPDVGIRREVDDRIGADEGRQSFTAGEEVQSCLLEAACVRAWHEMLLVPSREIVEREHLMVCSEQRVDQVGADEAGATGDNDLHRPTLAKRNQAMRQPGTGRWRTTEPVSADE